MKKLLFALLLAVVGVAHADPSTTFIESNPNSLSSDAFGRYRVSTIFPLFESKQLYQQDTVYWTTSTVGTGAAVTFDGTFSSNTLTSGTTATSLAGIQTRTYWPYSPGKSQQFHMTGCFFGTNANVIKRLGAFDENNGVFFMVSGTAGLSVNVRTNTSGAVVDTTVLQAAFNVDRLDGTGPSGYNLDLTKSQIFYIDYQWLAVGRIRYGVSVGKTIVICHVIDNVNVRSSVYMARPNLPVRYEIRNNGNTAAGAIMSLICASVCTEGGSQAPIYPRIGVNGPFAGIAPANGTWLPLVAVRVKAAFNRGANCRPVSYWAGTLNSNTDGTVGVFYNAQVTGGTWVSITNSAMEYNNTMTAMTITNTACVQVGTDGSTGTGSARGLGSSLDPFVWANFDWNQTTPDVWVLGFNGATGAANYLGGLNMEETR
jgi:hypothetical protein